MNELQREEKNINAYDSSSKRLFCTTFNKNRQTNKRKITTRLYINVTQLNGSQLDKARRLSRKERHEYPNVADRMF